jgi:hypothetical protein
MERARFATIKWLLTGMDRIDRIKKRKHCCFFIPAILSISVNCFLRLKLSHGCRAQFVDGVKAALLDSGAKHLAGRSVPPQQRRRRNYMREGGKGSRPIHRNLDTAYVNLAALLRYLRGRDFKGRVHVLLDEYEADVSLDAESEPRVREIDHASGREAEGEAALQRLLVRSREPGGLINVFSESEEDEAAGDEPEAELSTRRASEESGPRPEATAWREVRALSGELIAAVERAALSFGADFNSLLGGVRLELADDFPFLDPSAQRFQYALGTVRMSVEPEVKAYLSGISETLRRVVDRLVASHRSRSARERVALELAVLARRREPLIRELKMMPYLERIAGTKVL